MLNANIQQRSTNNLDIYQINSTTIQRLEMMIVSTSLTVWIQAFAPGIPQVYYVSS